MPKLKQREQASESFEANGNVWDPALINIKVSGQGNYILAKLKLLYPKTPKTALAKQILDEALLELDKKITGLP